ncbi:MAG: hypothetical protein HY721_25720, partial [Planctomycetes bacterium]|nr:hypothetical protein [Planctomycetota bacterium]
MATRPRLPTVLGLALLLSLPPLGAAPEGSWKDLRGRPTGFFHVEKLGSAWWIVDPDGRPFISKGVNHVSYAGDNSPKLGFSPYRKAVEAKHGSAEAWARASVERLRGWGFNTIGAWSSRETWRQGMPYTVILDLGSSAGGDWLKGSFPDVFSERFREAVRKAAQERCAPRRGDWLLLGYFTDNELRWGRDWRSKRGLLADFLELPEGSAGRREAERYVKGRRGEAGTSPLGEKDLEALEAGFVKLVASEYFKACAEAVRAADPDHMVLGCRFAGYAPQAVLEAFGE